MSSKALIIAKNLGKKYLINESRGGNYRNLMEELAAWYRKPTSLKKTHKEFWALKEVNFSIGAGESVGIIGTNGSGKSTLLKILARITWPTTGQVEIWGRVSALLEVGTGFHLELSGRENIFLSGAMLGMKRAEVTRYFDEIVAFSEVEKFLDTPVKRYSSGMFLRLAFAILAHLNNDILILDEILAVGDLHFQAKCLDKIAQIIQQGRTVLFVSHDLDKIKSLCKHILWLKEGHLFKTGLTAEVLTEYEELHQSNKSPNASLLN